MEYDVVIGITVLILIVLIVIVYRDYKEMIDLLNDDE